MMFAYLSWDVGFKKPRSRIFIQNMFFCKIFFSFFFYVGLRRTSFSGHLLSPIFQSTLHITITSLCLGVDSVRFSCLLLY